MKRLFSLLISLTLFFLLSFNTLALSDLDKGTSRTFVEYLDDGSYIITTITEEKTSYSAYASFTKSGSKITTYTGSDGEVKWTATLRGTFTYTGSSATCTASNITFSSNDSNWKATSATASRSSNKAIGDITVKHYVLGIPIKTIEATIILTCSANGTLS